MADRLVAVVDGTLAAARAGYRDLEVIAVNRGPGGFTGVRSGVAAARALALATGRPVLGLSALELLAWAAGAPDDGVVVAAIDARRQQVYAQAFDPRLVALGPPRAVDPAQAVEAPRGRVRLVGSGAALVRASFPDDVATELVTVDLDARLVARAASQRLAGGAAAAPGDTVRPLYLRAPDARPPAPVVSAVASAGA